MLKLICWWLFETAPLLYPFISRNWILALLLLVGGLNGSSLSPVSVCKCLVFLASLNFLISNKDLAINLAFC
jgi:hypothetical protein